MPRVTFVNADGTKIDVEVRSGETLLQAARAGNVASVVAECGGSLSCATCHVYVAEEWTLRLPPPSEDERAMVECAIDTRPNSRLSCQITLTPELDGLIVEVPDSQY